MGSNLVKMIWMEKSKLDIRCSSRANLSCCNRWNMSRMRQLKKTSAWEYHKRERNSEWIGRINKFSSLTLKSRLRHYPIMLKLKCRLICLKIITNRFKLIRFGCQRFTNKRKKRYASLKGSFSIKMMRLWPLKPKISNKMITLRI